LDHLGDIPHTLRGKEYVEEIIGGQLIFHIFDRISIIIIDFDANKTTRFKMQDITPQETAGQNPPTSLLSSLPASSSFVSEVLFLNRLVLFHFFCCQ